MNSFVDTVGLAGGVAAAVVVAVIILTLFFRALSLVSGSGSKPETMAVRGIFKRNTLATVHLTGGVKFERVKFVGFTNAQASKAGLPWELSGMVILEDTEKRKYLVRAKNVQMIVVEADANVE